MTDTPDHGAAELVQQAQREARFFDDVYMDAERRFSGNHFAIPEDLVREIASPGKHPLVDREYASARIGGLAGKRVLDYGCGDGWNTICLAKAGARVWAVDISEVGVELTKKMAAANSVADSVTAEVQDCYHTRFDANTFDVIYGSGIIHHLKIATAGQELNRILRRDGVAVFCEPIRETAVMDYIKAVVLFLKGTKPESVTEDEENLTLEKIATLKKFFRVVNCRQFIVLSAASAVISARPVRRFLLWADYLLMRIVPGFSKLGRSVVIELREPIEPAT